MKNKGFIISILFILALGAGVTVGTKRFVSEGETARELTTEAYQSSPFSAGAGIPPEAAPQMAAVPDTDGSERRTGRSAGMAAGKEPRLAEKLEEEENSLMEDIQETDANAGLPEAKALIGGGTEVTEAVPEEAGVLVEISPLTGSSSKGEQETAAPGCSSQDYAKRLEEIDASLKKMRDNGIDPTTDSYKNMIEYEYRVWDGELNSLYLDILKQMPEKEASDLKEKERQWIREKDLKAKKAADRFSGGTMESLEYTASLVNSTRSRAYELLEEYGSYLDKKKE